MREEKGLPGFERVEEKEWSRRERQRWWRAREREKERERETEKERARKRPRGRKKERDKRGGEGRKKGVIVVTHRRVSSRGFVVVSELVSRQNYVCELWPARLS